MYSIHVYMYMYKTNKAWGFFLRKSMLTLHFLALKIKQQKTHKQAASPFIKKKKKRRISL